MVDDNSPDSQNAHHSSTPLSSWLGAVVSPPSSPAVPSQCRKTAGSHQSGLHRIELTAASPSAPFLATSIPPLLLWAWEPTTMPFLSSEYKKEMNENFVKTVVHYWCSLPTGLHFFALPQSLARTILRHRVLLADSLLCQDSFGQPPLEHSLPLTSTYCILLTFARNQPSCTFFDSSLAPQAIMSAFLWYVEDMESMWTINRHLKPVGDLLLW